MAANNGLSDQDLEPTSWGALREICNSCLDYFSTHQDEVGQKINNALKVILDKLEELRPLYLEISEFAPLFDFDDDTPGNGYRSFLYLVDRCIFHTTATCQDLFNQKNSMLFRKNNHMRFVYFIFRLSLNKCK